MKKVNILKRTVFGGLFLACIGVGIVGCNKEEVKVNKTTLENRPSLDEFIQNAETEGETIFFKTHEIIDNTKICHNALSEIQLKVDKPKKPKAKVKFKWGGTGCVNAIGICVIIPLLHENEDGNANISIYDEKLILTLESEDNGLTSDGFLPIYEDIFVDDSTTIEAGIYKADIEAKAIALNIRK
ncbi:MAG TPA: hypothetical protein VNJ50_04740 [Gelidibacter sp.]|uniref:hypothetical protein n=1 Tax=Gelidibacter sp. TaxID=2018083 RepID=UPI002BA1969E|nr:hypothetical protein [Gelidibacter sp.]HXJ98130.1 hypothetical protein [Gelidibacter sp.]